VPSAADAAEQVVYLGLGANLGDRPWAIAAAVAWLAARGHLFDVHLSPFYETDAVADHPQPPYLNAVLRGRTTRSPAELLAACLAAEEALGRTRPAGISKAARSIDVDVLLFGDIVVDTPTLKVPHPALLERPFVRVPLADVAAVGLTHPVTGVALDIADAHPGVRMWQAVG
jgi:2-amino-4-hydroxy-6-hydroxymethyldihydropteridine diphosphokinase